MRQLKAKSAEEVKEADLFTTYDSIEELLPERGWLGQYFQYAQDLEACPRFKFYTACAILGTAVNNRVWLQRGDEGLLPKLFSNIWVVLLSPPGRGHKTSTINMGVNCLQAACPEMRILADKLTPETLVKNLSDPVTQVDKIRIGQRDAIGLIKAPELSVFFGRQQYNVGLIQLVTDLYDFREEWSASTITRGSNTLKNICISILGGSTPEWLQRMLPDDAFTGGFMSRFVLVEMPPSYYKRRAYPARLSKVGWKDLVQTLRDTSHLSGEMGWTPESTVYYQEYYESRKPSGDVQKDAYLEREPEQILRLSMLLALSEKRMYISIDDVKHARRLFDALMEETSPRIERLTTHPRMALVQDIINLLKQFGTITEKILLKKVYRSLSLGEQQFHEAIRVLKITGTIENVGSAGVAIYKLKKEEEV